MEFYESEETNLLRRIVSWVTDVIVVIAIACFTVYAFGTQIPISGSSMQPALETEDVVLVNRLIYDFQSPDRFDVVVFRREDGKWNVKRVIGLPGETVQIKDGKIYINDSTACRKKNPHLSSLRQVWQNIRSSLEKMSIFCWGTIGTVVKTAGLPMSAM